MVILLRMHKENRKLRDTSKHNNQLMNLVKKIWNEQLNGLRHFIERLVGIFLTRKQ